MARINGTDGADSLTGGPGKDIIEGFGGDDTLAGGGGQNRLFGGDGEDLLTGGAGNDSLHGGAGDDRLVDAVGGGDLLQGGDGNDLISIVRNTADYHKRVELVGEAGSDRLSFTGPADGPLFSGVVKMDGGAGDDVLHASGFASIRAYGPILGDEGNDVIHVTNSVDAYVRGDAGDDVVTLSRSSGARIEGDDGDDLITVIKPDQALISGGDGNDTLVVKGRPVVYVSLYTSEGYGDRVRLDDVAMGHTLVNLVYSQHAEITIESTKAHPQLGTLKVGAFTPGDTGDQLVLGAYLPHVLHGWDGSTDPFAAGYLRLQSVPHQSSVLQVDRDGAGSAFDWTDLVSFGGSKADHFTAFNFDGYDPDAMVT